MEKLRKRIASLITAAAIAITAVTLPETGGLLPAFTVKASAADASTVFGEPVSGLYTLGNAKSGNTVKFAVKSCVNGKWTSIGTASKATVKVK